MENFMVSHLARYSHSVHESEKSFLVSLTSTNLKPLTNLMLFKETLFKKTRANTLRILMHLRAIHLFLVYKKIS